MGRTVMPYSHVLESEREWWQPFRRSLSKEDQEAFARLFDRSKMHTSAGLHVPALAGGHHPPVHLPGTREDDRGDSWLAQREGGVLIALGSRTVSSGISHPAILSNPFLKKLIKIQPPALRSGELSLVCQNPTSQAVQRKERTPS